MDFGDVGQMQSSFGLGLADLGSRAALQEEQMRQLALENLKQRMAQIWMQRKQMAMQKKQANRELLTKGVGAGASVASMALLAPYLLPAAVGAGAGAAGTSGWGGSLMGSGLFGA